MGMKAGMTATQAYSSVAETTGLKSKDVKGVMEGLIELAAEELKKTGSFKLGGVLNMKLKKKPATPARKGVNPFTKEPCVFKASLRDRQGLANEEAEGDGELKLKRF